MAAGVRQAHWPLFHALLQSQQPFCGDLEPPFAWPVLLAIFDTLLVSEERFKSICWIGRGKQSDSDENNQVNNKKMLSPEQKSQSHLLARD